MPIYEYECHKCGGVFEKIQKFSEPELTVCECGKAGTVKKLISAAAFHLKGSGWYVTDFRDKGKKSAESNADKNESTGSEKNESSDTSSKEETTSGSDSSSETPKSAADTSSEENSKPSSSAD